MKQGAERMGLALSTQQSALLERFEGILRERAIPAGLVAASDAGRLRERHILDSLSAAAVFGSGDREAVDLGSGAGLPGIPLAIALPGCDFALVESKARRAGFVELALETLSIPNARVVRARAEDLAGEILADVALARALAPLPRSWRLARPLLRAGGRLIYFAGASLGDVRAELGRAGPPEPGEWSVLPVLDSHRRLVIMSRT